MNRSAFDNKSVSFEEHKTREHNMWHYLNFIVLVIVKKKTEFTGPESYVYELVKVCFQYEKLLTVSCLNNLYMHTPFLFLLARKYIQWNLSNLTHQGTRKCVGLYRMSEYSGFILVNRNIWDHKFLSDVT